jgi:hypothetical protein
MMFVSYVMKSCNDLIVLPQFWFCKRSREYRLDCAKTFPGHPPERTRKKTQARKGLGSCDCHANDLIRAASPPTTQRLPH